MLQTDGDLYKEARHAVRSARFKCLFPFCETDLASIARGVLCKSESHWVDSFTAQECEIFGDLSYLKLFAIWGVVHRKNWKLQSDAIEYIFDSMKTLGPDFDVDMCVVIPNCCLRIGNFRHNKNCENNKAKAPSWFAFDRELWAPNDTTRLIRTAFEYIRGRIDYMMMQTLQVTLGSNVCAIITEYGARPKEYHVCTENDANDLIVETPPALAGSDSDSESELESESESDSGSDSGSGRKRARKT
jgi:hypothetical protein